jgi:hypothetical protein
MLVRPALCAAQHDLRAHRQSDADLTATLPSLRDASIRQLMKRQLTGGRAGDASVGAG